MEPNVSCSCDVKGAAGSGSEVYVNISIYTLNYMIYVALWSVIEALQTHFFTMKKITSA